MKKKNYFYLAALSLAMTFSMGACSDNDDPTPNGGGKDPVSLDYSSENAVAWGNYMYNVAMLLNNDATTLYNSWVTDYVDEQGSHVHTPLSSKIRLPALTKASFVYRGNDRKRYVEHRQRSR